MNEWLHRGPSTYVLEQEIWIPVPPFFSWLIMCLSLCSVEILEILTDFVFAIILCGCCYHSPSSTLVNEETGAQKTSEWETVRGRLDPRLCAGIFFTGISIPSLLPSLSFPSGFIYEVGLYESVSSQEMGMVLGISNRGTLTQEISHTGGWRNWESPRFKYEKEAAPTFRAEGQWEEYRFRIPGVRATSRS